MHRWGDPEVDWDGIDGAAAFIAERLRSKGIHVTDCKEKYGTVRVYCALAEHQFEDYTRAYQEAVDRWPHLSAEILGGADFPELLSSCPNV